MISDITQASSFGWASLDEETRAFIQEKDAQLDELDAREGEIAKSYDEIRRQKGIVLIAVRKKLPPKQFSSWLHSRNMSHRTAYRYIADAEKSIHDCDTVSQSSVQESEEPVVLSTKGVQPGQWWQLGQHRLYCGNSATNGFFDLCKQAEASFAFADPPYNAGVAEWDNDFTWQHDYLMDIAPVVAVTPGISAIKDFMQTTSMPYKWSMAYWISNGMTRGALGFGNWIYVALFAYDSLHRNAQDFAKVSISSADRDELDHKGRKPRAVMRHLVNLFSDPGQAVIDPFLGTGTTLIACEELERVCIGAELNVDYCESIIRLWEKLTGREAIPWH